MERLEERIQRLKAAANADKTEVKNFLGFLHGSVQAIEYGLETGHSIGEYIDETRYIRAYAEKLTRLALTSYGFEEAANALSDEMKGENK